MQTTNKTNGTHTHTALTHTRAHLRINQGADFEDVKRVEDLLIVMTQRSADARRRRVVHTIRHLRPFSLATHILKAAFFVHDLSRNQYAISSKISHGAMHGEICIALFCQMHWHVVHCGKFRCALMLTINRLTINDVNLFVECIVKTRTQSLRPLRV